jgi:hypothetical protein
MPKKPCPHLNLTMRERIDLLRPAQLDCRMVKARCDDCGETIELGFTIDRQPRRGT